MEAVAIVIVVSMDYFHMVTATGNGGGTGKDDGGIGGGIDGCSRLGNVGIGGQG